MSEVTTLLAWLIPLLVIVIAFIAWRIYVYQTRGPILPSYLQRNIFARTRSFLPRTLSIGSNKDVATTVAPTAPIRNETNIDMSGQQQPMTSVSSSQPLNSQSFAPLAHEKENVPVTPGTLTDSTPSGQAIPNESSRAPPSPAIERLLSMK